MRSWSASPQRVARHVFVAASVPALVRMWNLISAMRESVSGAGGVAGAREEICAALNFVNLFVERN